MSFDFKSGLSRQEKTEQIVNWILSSKDNATRFLQEAGILDAQGEVAEMYR